jgi:site-specific recombinase XerD
MVDVIDKPASGAVDVIPAGSLALVVDDRDPWPPLLADWFASKRFSPRTVDSYNRAVAEWVAWCEAKNITPLDATRRDVDRWARHLEDGGQASTTVARKLATLASLYGYAATEGVLDTSPVTNVNRPKTGDRHKAPALDKAEARAFLAAADNDTPRTRALVRLLIANGLRISEALAADLADLDRERGHRVLRILGKGSQAATVALAVPTAFAIDEYLDGRTSGPLFTTRTGGRLDRHNVRKQLHRLERRAGLVDEAGRPKLSPHSMRATSITLLLDSGASLRDAQDHARHADPRTTRGYDRRRQSLDHAPTHGLVRWLEA